MSVKELSAPRIRLQLLVPLLCFLAIVCDGYDLMVYGSVVLSLLNYEPWGLDEKAIGAIAGAGTLGMLIGALAAGALADYVGRRKILIAGLIWTSASMALLAVAPTPELFGLSRFLNGIGIGGMIPSAIALTVEYTSGERRNRANAMMFSGSAVGGILAASLAVPLIPAFGFRVMFWVGVVPGLLLLPFALRYLPDSAAFLASKGRNAELERLAERFGLSGDELLASTTAEPTGDSSPDAERRSPIRSLFGRPYAIATALFAVASFFGLMLIYGITTWLPSVMNSAGQSRTNSVAFLVALNIGAIVGVVLGSYLADRYSVKLMTSGAFVSAAASIVALSVPLPIAVLYVLVAIAGFGTIGTQILLNGFVATHYPAPMRGTALGWSLGVGRVGAIAGPVLGGVLLGAGLQTSWNFYAFAIPAVLGAAVVLLVPLRPLHGTAVR